MLIRKTRLSLCIVAVLSSQPSSLVALEDGDHRLSSLLSPKNSHNVSPIPDEKYIAATAAGTSTALCYGGFLLRYMYLTPSIPLSMKRAIMHGGVGLGVLGGISLTYFLLTSENKHEHVTRNLNNRSE